MTQEAFPANYTVPEVWTGPAEPPSGGSKLNSDTAGARRERELPRGEHAVQLYSLGTPNGRKVTILLEELGIEYDAYKINIGEGDQFDSDFVKINPNSKIPALLDYSVTPPLPVFESGSILIYLAEKEGKFIPKDIRKRTACINWLMWQMGTAPVLGGGFGHFLGAPIKIQYAIDRFTMETKRIIDVLDKHLDGKAYVCDDEYTIADMAIFTWMLSLKERAGKFLSFDSYTNVNRWMDALGERDAVKRGLRVNHWGADGVMERHSPADFDA